MYVSIRATPSTANSRKYDGSIGRSCQTTISSKPIAILFATWHAAPVRVCHEISALNRSIETHAGTPAMDRGLGKYGTASRDLSKLLPEAMPSKTSA